MVSLWMHFWVNTRLLWRIVAPISAVSLLLLVVGGGSAWYVHRHNVRVSRDLDRYLSSVIASEEILLLGRDAQAEMERYAARGDSSYLAGARVACRQIDRPLQKLKLVADEHSRELREAISSELELFLASPPEDISPTESGEIADGWTSRVLVPAQALLEQNRQRASDESASNQLLADRIGLGLFLLGFCGAAAGLVAGYGIARGVTRRIHDLGGSVRDIADRLGAVVPAPHPGAEGDLPVLQITMKQLQVQTANVVQELNQSRLVAERSGHLAALGQLAAGLAHELRNPLASIKLLVQAARDEQGVFAERELEVLEEEIVRLEQLSQTFLDFARPPQLEKQLIDLSALARQAAEFVRPRAEQNGVAIECSTPEPACSIEADAQQLRQVFLNLLLNAIEAQPDGGQVSLQVAGCRERMSITVADSGPGLPVEIGERIFEPFVSTKEAGVGLGLSISRRIVELHGGDIRAQNRPEGGSVVTVELPAAWEAQERRLSPHLAEAGP